MRRRRAMKIQRVQAFNDVGQPAVAVAQSERPDEYDHPKRVSVYFQPGTGQTEVSWHSLTARKGRIRELALSCKIYKMDFKWALYAVTIHRTQVLYVQHCMPILPEI